MAAVAAVAELVVALAEVMVPWAQFVLSGALVALVEPHLSHRLT